MNISINMTPEEYVTDAAEQFDPGVYVAVSWCYLLRMMQMNLQPALRKADNKLETLEVRMLHMGRAQVIDEIRILAQQTLDTVERELRQRGQGSPWPRPAA